MKKSVLLLIVLFNVFWVANAQIVFKQSAETNIYPVDDSYVREENPTTIYQDSNPTQVQVRYQSDTQKRYTYLKFEIPQNLEGITYNAMLTLWGGNSNVALDMNIVLAENTWSETTLNWENRPNLIPDVVPVILNLPHPDKIYGYFDADITSLIAGKEGEMVTLVIMHPNISGENVTIFSKDQTDADKKPTLSFNITDPLANNENLIPNGDFEADTLPWVYAWGAANANFSIDNNSALNGTGSMMIEVVNPSTSGAWWDAGIKNAFELEIEKGKAYVFSFVSKAAEARKMHFDVKVGDLKLLDKAIDLTTDAKKFTFGFTATVSGLVTIQFMPTIHGATVYIDDLSFIKLDDQQIPNGDFEADTLPWIYAWGAANANFSIDNNSALNGTGSLMIEVVNPSSTGAWWDAGIKNSFPVYVEKGSAYVFSFVSKAAEARKMHFDVKVGDLKLLDKAIDLTTDAKKFTFGFTASVSGMVTIQLMPTIHGATVYMDDLSFVKLENQQISNGDFEAAALPWIYGWGAANASFSIDNNSALNGTGSLMIEVINPSTTGAWWDAGIRNNFPVYVEKGAVYVFSFASKAAEARKMHFDVKVGDLKLLDKEIELTTDAKKFTYGFTASVSGMVTIQLMPTIHGATVYMDDISFVKLDDQQIPNYNFEADTLQWVYAWGAANASFSIDNNSALNGKGSLKIEVNNPSTTGAWWDAGIKNNFPVYVEKGQKYVFKLDAKATAARKMHFDVKVGDLKLLDKAIDLTDAKQTFSFSFIAGVSGMVTIQFMPTISGETVYLDNISFTQGQIILIQSLDVAGADNVTEITALGGTLQMKATILPEDADIQAVVWSVANGTGEATISDKGLLTAVSNGTVVVKATATDGSQIAGETTITISGQDTGIDVLSGQFGIYPNPATSQLTVSSDIPVKRLEVLSLDGRVLQVIQVNELKVTFSVQSLKTGIFIIRVTDENNQQHVQRFVKE